MIKKSEAKQQAAKKCDLKLVNRFEVLMDKEDEPEVSQTTDVIEDMMSSKKLSSAARMIDSLDPEESIKSRKCSLRGKVID